MRLFVLGVLLLGSLALGCGRSAPTCPRCECKCVNCACCEACPGKCCQK